MWQSTNNTTEHSVNRNSIHVFLSVNNNCTKIVLYLKCLALLCDRNAWVYVLHHPIYWRCSNCLSAWYSARLVMQNAITG